MTFVMGKCVFLFTLKVPRKLVADNNLFFTIILFIENKA